MGFGLGHPSLALYRSIKGGESGLNLRLSDLLDREVIVPNLYEIVKSFFTRKTLSIKIKAYPNKIIEQLYIIQRGVDKQIEKEIEKGKRSSGL